jgi:hypothetical protein
MARPKRPLIIGFVGGLLFWVGVAAAAAGGTLVVLGRSGFVVAISGGVLVLACFVARRLARDALRPFLAAGDDHVTTIYMPLLDKGTASWRPVRAMKFSEDRYMVIEPRPLDEAWAFEPGHVLRCERREFGDRAGELVPVEHTS